MRLVAAPLVLFATTALLAGETDTTARWEAFSRARAQALADVGDFVDAEEEWLALAALRPGDAEPLVRAALVAVEAPTLGRAALEPGTQHYDLAKRCIGDAVARGTSYDGRVAYAIGRLQFADGHWGQAWHALRQAVEWGFDPLRARVWFYRAAINRAALLVDSGPLKLAEVVDELRTLDRNQPGHPDRTALRINLASAHRALDERDEARRLLEETLRDDPRSAPAVHLLGKILLDENKLPEALARFREARALAGANYGDPTWGNALLREADTLIKLQRLPDAEAAVNQYLEIRKDDAEGLFVLGRIRYASGDLDAAVRNFRRVVRMQLVTVASLTQLKQALHQMGEEAEAAEVQQRLDEVLRRQEAEASGMGPLPPPRPMPGR